VPKIGYRPINNGNTSALKGPGRKSSELRGDKWVVLPDIVDESSDVSQLVQLAREHPPKNHRPKGDQLLRDVLKIRSWNDPNTAILYAYSLWEGKRKGDSHAAFLFNVKFDASGNAKIIKTERVPDSKIEG
jgi:hypothetical protein